MLGTGAGLVRETASLVLGNYFRKRREFVEMVMQAGTGVGIVLFSVVYKEAVGWVIARIMGKRMGLYALADTLLGMRVGPTHSLKSSEEDPINLRSHRFFARTVDARCKFNIACSLFFFHQATGPNGKLPEKSWTPVSRSKYNPSICNDY